MKAEMRIQGITLKFLLAKGVLFIDRELYLYRFFLQRTDQSALSTALDYENIPILTRASQSFFVTLSQSHIGSLAITRSERRSREVLRL